MSFNPNPGTALLDKPAVAPCASRLIVAIAIAFLAFPAWAGADDSTSPQPNIVYLLLDDAGYGDLGCYGQEKLATPNIDRLAAEGMRFTNHYSGSTVCAPTRCVLMTGLHTGHAEVRGNLPGGPRGFEGEYPLSADAVTVAGLLKDQGYATGCFGKWGLGGPGSTGEPTRHGFDRFYGYYSQAFAHDYYPRWLWDNGQKVILDRKEYAHTLIWDQGLDFIRDNKDRPFFCYLPVTIPHAAMQAPEEYMPRFREEYPQFNDRVGLYGGDDRDTHVKNPIAGFAAMMTKLDDDVGQLMTLLAELDLDENTVVMLTSDNGPHHEGGHDPEFWNSNGPFRGTKRSLYEGGIRCPLIVRWPGMIEAGVTTDHLSAHWDLLPTLCNLAGSPEPEGIDGLSYLPTLLGWKEQPQHEYLYWEFYEQGGRQAVRFGNWKAVRNNLAKNPFGPIELYDITTDLEERDNLASQRPEVVQQAAVYFEHAHTPDPAWSKR